MKFSLTLGLLTAFVLTSCEIDEPPPRRRPAPRYPANVQQSQYPPQPQPYPGDGTQQAPPPDVASEPQTAPAPPAPTSVPKADYQYGVPVPGKPGFVHSPYSPDKMTDVRGYAPGTEVKDPYTGKIFLVP